MITLQRVNLDDGTPNEAKIPKVPAAIGLVKNKQESKNSLLKDSS
jgi:hypothetical protein